jgi:hypothetical protein
MLKNFKLFLILDLHGPGYSPEKVAKNVLTKTPNISTKNQKFSKKILKVDNSSNMVRVPF